MVINDGDVFRSRVRPPEDNAPLVVDTDGMETRQVALKGFQTITGGNREVMEGASLVQLDVGEGPNHEEAVALIRNLA